jgi:hypothetical protein
MKRVYASKAIGEICRLHDYRLSRVSLDMGKAENYLSKMLTRGDMPQTDTMARMLDHLGYGLYAVPYDEVPDSAGAMQLTYKGQETK